jgi:hypothetical protein
VNRRSEYMSRKPPIERVFARSRLCGIGQKFFAVSFTRHHSLWSKSIDEILRALIEELKRSKTPGLTGILRRGKKFARCP